MGEVRLRIPVLVGMTALVLAASSSAARAQLRIYDPVGTVKTEVTLAEVVRSSARASRLPGGGAILSFRLTPKGIIGFNILTRSLARRGARLGHPQRVVVEVDGWIVARPLVDYVAFPNGLDGAPGIQLNVIDLGTARRLALAIRR